MITISLCMIVKDEVDALPYCLYTVKDIVDEIIIVDVGLKDKTKETAKKFTNKIYDFKYEEDYSKARNFSFSKATKDYILWLDPEDIVLDIDRLKLMQLKKRLEEQVDVVMMKYNNGKDENGNPQLLFTRERLVKRKNNYIWKDSIHEYIEVYGNIIYEDIVITHRKVNYCGNKCVKSFEDKITSSELSSPKGNFYYGRELYLNNKNEEAINQFKDFLKDDKGTLECKVKASIMLSKCYKSLNEYDKAKKILVKSFIYDIPSAEACCEMGFYYKENGEYKKAIQWLKIAISIDKPETYIYNEQDYYDFIPYLELSCCYYNLKNIGMAKFYHNKAKRLKPNHKIILENDKFYSKV